MNLVERIMKNVNAGEDESIFGYINFLPQEIINEEFKLSEEAEKQLCELIEYLRKYFKGRYNNMEYTDLNPKYRESMYKINIGLESIMYTIKTKNIDFTPLAEMTLEDKMKGKGYELSNRIYLDYILNNEPLFILDYYGSHKRCELNDVIKGYIKGELKVFRVIELLGHIESSRRDGTEFTRRKVKVVDLETNKLYYVEWTSLGSQEVSDFDEKLEN